MFPFTVRSVMLPSPAPSLPRNEVGVVNSPCWSQRLNKSLALVHLQPGATRPGTRLEVAGDDFNGSATVETIPFFDPGKTRTHA